MKLPAMTGKLRLVLSADGWLGRVTLVNPPANVLDRPDFADAGALEAFFDTPGLKAAIVAGDGRHFSAGADPAALRDARRETFPISAEALDLGKRALQASADAPVPVLACIRGSCLGAGLEIALACHFRLASRNAMLGFPESERGLLPGLGGTSMATRLIGRAAAIDLILSGRLIRGEEAAELGLVDGCCRQGELESGSVERLRALTEGRSCEQIRSIMTSINNSRRLPLADALREESRLFCALARSARGEQAGG